MPAGRPSLYTEELAAVICERLAHGDPLARICASDEMPGYSTVRLWESTRPEFLALSARARLDGTHFLADDCLRIADDPELEPADKRVRIDTRLRLIGKWNSKAYGDKIEHEHGVTSELASLLARVDGKTRAVVPTFEIVDADNVQR